MFISDNTTFISPTQKHGCRKPTRIASRTHKCIWHSSLRWSFAGSSKKDSLADSGSVCAVVQIDRRPSSTQSPGSVAMLEKRRTLVDIAPLFWKSNSFLQVHLFATISPNNKLDYFMSKCDFCTRTFVNTPRISEHRAGDCRNHHVRRQVLNASVCVHRTFGDGHSPRV